MTRLLALGVALLTLTFVLSPLASPPFTGFRPDQLPVPQIDPPVQPAGYAFAIWGVIYLWLVVSAGYGLLRRAGAEDWDHVRRPLIVSLAAGTPWLFVATRSALGAFVLIFVMLIPAIIALLRAPSRDRVWLRTPLALYAGWLTAASCVTVATVAAGYDLWFGAGIWAVIALALAFLIARWVQPQRPETPEYSATVIWALVAVVVANGAEHPGIAAIAGAGALGLALLYWTDRHPRSA
ncbi:hypothetical protein [Dinoroseobacter sp. S76]|uniref:hypothetical protein n=1 Tax=Dinoroseobacter sp. S76 TaxID=3415124 RepID=UPI003C7A4C58